MSKKKAAAVKKKAVPMKKKAAAPKKKAVPMKKKAAAPKKKAVPMKKKAAAPKKQAAPAKKTAPAKEPVVPAKQVLEPTKAAPKPIKVAPPPKPEPPKKPNIPLPSATLSKLRSILEAERVTYLRQADDLAAEAAALIAEREPGEVQFDEESGEGDTVAAERERDLTLSASARAAVEEIDRALVRIETIDYGYCANCGNKIPLARLEALPYAALCIPCKSREERRR